MLKTRFRLFAIMIAVATAAHADIIATPDSTSSLAVYDSLGTTHFCTAACSLGAAGISMATTPAILLQGQTTAGGGFSGNFTYYVHASGGNDGDVVQVLVAGFLSASGIGDGAHGYVDTAGANLEFFGIRVLLNVNDLDGGSLRICEAACVDTTAGSWVGTVSATAISGNDYPVQLSISGDAQDGFASAVADPYIYIDPVFLASHPGYSLQFSAGVSNALASSGTPEPATFLLVGLGAGIAVWWKSQGGKVRSAK